MMDYYNKSRNTKDKQPLFLHNIPGGPISGPISLNKHEHKLIKNNRQRKMLQHTPVSGDSHHATHEQCPMQEGPLPGNTKTRDCSEHWGEGNTLCFSARSIMIPESQFGPTLKRRTSAVAATLWRSSLICCVTTVSLSSRFLRKQQKFGCITGWRQREVEVKRTSGCDTRTSLSLYYARKQSGIPENSLRSRLKVHGDAVQSTPAILSHCWVWQTPQSRSTRPNLTPVSNRSLFKAPINCFCCMLVNSQNYNHSRQCWRVR